MTSTKKPLKRDGTFQGEAANGFIWDETDGWVRDENNDGKLDVDKAPEGFKVHEGEGYGSPPDRDGKFSDEVVGQYRWDVTQSDWVEHVGSRELPPGHVRVGDGTEGNPHRIIPAPRW